LSTPRIKKKVEEDEVHNPLPRTNGCLCIQSLGNLHGVKDKNKYSFLAFCQSRSSLEDDYLAIGG